MNHFSSLRLFRRKKSFLKKIANRFFPEITFESSWSLLNLRSKFVEKLIPNKYALAFLMEAIDKYRSGLTDHIPQSNETNESSIINGQSSTESQNGSSTINGQLVWTIYTTSRWKALTTWKRMERDQNEVTSMVGRGKRRKKTGQIEHQVDE